MKPRSWAGLPLAATQRWVRVPGPGRAWELCRPPPPGAGVPRPAPRRCPALPALFGWARFGSPAAGPSPPLPAHLRPQFTCAAAAGPTTLSAPVPTLPPGIGCQPPNQEARRAEPVSDRRTGSCGGLRLRSVSPRVGVARGGGLVGLRRSRRFGGRARQDARDQSHSPG